MGVPNLIGVEDLALILHLSERTVRKRVWAGEWPFTRMGRRVLFTEAQVNEIVAKSAVPARSSRRRSA